MLVTMVRFMSVKLFMSMHMTASSACPWLIHEHAREAFTSTTTIDKSAYGQKSKCDQDSYKSYAEEY